jgi:quinol monooxygenase YgiN
LTGSIFLILLKFEDFLSFVPYLCYDQKNGQIAFASSLYRRKGNMVSVALLVRLETKPGKEADVERFLRDSLSLVQEEPATTAWFAIRMGPSTFGIFDAFPDESGRQAHLSGRVAAALAEKASELFAQPPTIERVDVLAAKMPSLLDGSPSWI